MSADIFTGKRHICLEAEQVGGEQISSNITSINFGGSKAKTCTLHLHDSPHFFPHCSQVAVYAKSSVIPRLVKSVLVRVS